MISPKVFLLLAGLLGLGAATPGITGYRSLYPDSYQYPNYYRYLPYTRSVTDYPKSLLTVPKSFNELPLSTVPRSVHDYPRIFHPTPVDFTRSSMGLPSIDYPKDSIFPIFPFINARSTHDYPRSTFEHPKSVMDYPRIFHPTPIDFTRRSNEFPSVDFPIVPFVNSRSVHYYPRSTFDLPKSVMHYPKSTFDLPKRVMDYPRSTFDLPKRVMDYPRTLPLTPFLHYPRSVVDYPRRPVVLPSPIDTPTIESRSALGVLPKATRVPLYPTLMDVHPRRSVTVIHDRALGSLPPSKDIFFGTSSQ